jgi:hypothetical protein
MPGTRILTTFIYTRQCRVRALKGLSSEISASVHQNLNKTALKKCFLIQF